MRSRWMFYGDRQSRREENTERESVIENLFMGGWRTHSFTARAGVRSIKDNLTKQRSQSWTIGLRTLGRPVSIAEMEEVNRRFSRMVKIEGATIL